MISLLLFDLSLPSTPDPPKYITESDPQKLLNLRDEGEERRHLQDKLSLFPPRSRLFTPTMKLLLQTEIRTCTDGFAGITCHNSKGP